MRIHNFTICDQVRQENTGKFFIIGAYSNEITFGQLPAQFELSVWMLIEAETLGHHKFAFRGSMPQTQGEIFNIDGGMDIIDTTIWTPLGFGVVSLIGQPGTLVLEAKLDDGDWFELRTVRIKRGILTAPQTVMPPNR